MDQIPRILEYCSFCRGYSELVRNLPPTCVQPEPFFTSWGKSWEQRNQRARNSAPASGFMPRRILSNRIDATDQLIQKFSTLCRTNQSLKQAEIKSLKEFIRPTRLQGTTLRDNDNTRRKIKRAGTIHISHFTAFYAFQNKQTPRS